MVKTNSSYKKNIKHASSISYSLTPLINIMYSSEGYENIAENISIKITEIMYTGNGD